MLCCVGKKTERKIANGKFRKPFYNFVSVASGKVLDVEQDSDKQAVIVINQRNGGETQKFEIEQKGPDYFIRTKKGKQYLTVEGPQNGVKVYLTAKDQNQNQRFRIQQLKGGQKKYVIYTFFGKVIDVINDQAQEGSIIQEDFIGEAHQLWTLISDQKTN